MPAQYRPLSRARRDRRARQVRPGLRRRQPGRLGWRPRPGDPQPGQPSAAFRAGDAVVGAVAGDRKYRLRRHGVDDLRGSVSAGAKIRVARPHQQGPRRLERGDDRRPMCRRISRSPGIRRMPTATSGPRNSSISCSTSGIRYEDDALHPRQAERRLPRSRQGPQGQSSRQVLSTSPARSTSRARRRAGRWWCRPAPPSRAASWRRAPPR